MGVSFTDFGAFRAPYLLHLPYLYHLIRHALAVGFDLGTYTYLSPQRSDTGCECLYLLEALRAMKHSLPGTTPYAAL